MNNYKKYKANILFYEPDYNMLRILYRDGLVEVLCLTQFDNITDDYDWRLSIYSSLSHLNAFRDLLETHILVGEV